jgi:hypothetical protein
MKSDYRQVGNTELGLVKIPNVERLFALAKTVTYKNKITSESLCEDAIENRAYQVVLVPGTTNMDTTTRKRIRNVKSSQSQNPLLACKNGGTYLSQKTRSWFTLRTQSIRPY